MARTKPTQAKSSVSDILKDITLPEDIPASRGSGARAVMKDIAMDEKETNVGIESSIKDIMKDIVLPDEPTVVEKQPEERGAFVKFLLGSRGFKIEGEQARRRQALEQMAPRERAAEKVDVQRLMEARRKKKEDLDLWEVTKQKYGEAAANLQRAWSPKPIPKGIGSWERIKGVAGSLLDKLSATAGLIFSPPAEIASEYAKPTDEETRLKAQSLWKSISTSKDPARSFIFNFPNFNYEDYKDMDPEIIRNMARSKVRQLEVGGVAEEFGEVAAESERQRQGALLMYEFMTGIVPIERGVALAVKGGKKVLGIKPPPVKVPKVKEIPKEKLAETVEKNLDPVNVAKKPPKQKLGPIEYSWDGLKRSLKERVKIPEDWKTVLNSAEAASVNDLARAARSMKVSQPISETKRALLRSEYRSQQQATMKTAREGGIPWQDQPVEYAKALAKKLNIPKITPPTEHMATGLVKRLKAHIWNHRIFDDMFEGERFNVSNVFNAYIDHGVVPTLTELNKWRPIFGNEFVRTIVGQMSRSKKILKYIADTGNFIRAGKAAYDLSAPLRQGLVLGAMHPLKFGRYFGQQFLAFASPKYYQKLVKMRKEDPFASLHRKAGLDFSEVGGTFKAEEDFLGAGAEAWGGLAKMEFRGVGYALWPARLAGKGVEASNRAMVGFLNEQRRGVFNVWAEKMLKAGVDPKTAKGLAELQTYAKVLNLATGRGPTFGLNPKIWSNMLFSLRLTTSRILHDPYVIGVIAKGIKQGNMRMVYFGARELTSRFIAYAAMGALINRANEKLGLDLNFGWDPGDALNFLKIRHGNVSHDMSAGFGPWYRLLASAIFNERIDSRTGKVVKSDFLDQLKLYAFYKAAPLPSTAISILRRKTPIGEPLTIGEVLKMGTPFPIVGETFIDAINDGGAEGLVNVIPEIFGAGTQIYTRGRYAKPKKLSMEDITEMGERRREEMLERIAESKRR